MNIDYLKEFIDLSETFSFSATARRFYVSSSVLSKHISAMEKELAVKLLRRDSHGVELTACGEVFLEEAREIVNCWDRAVTRLEMASKSYRRVVRVGYLRNAAHPFIAMFLKRMARCNPDIKVIPICMEYGELFDAIGTRKVDFSFGLDPSFGDTARCGSMPMYKDRFDVIVGSKHPLAEKKGEGILVEDLKPFHLLLPSSDRYPGMSEYIASLLPADHEGEIGHYGDVDSLYLGVELQNAVGFSSEHNMPMFGERIDFIRINDENTEYYVSAIWNRDTEAEVVDPCIDVARYCTERLQEKGYVI